MEDNKFAGTLIKKVESFVNDQTFALIFYLGIFTEICLFLNRNSLAIIFPFAVVVALGVIKRTDKVKAAGGEVI